MLNLRRIATYGSVLTLSTVALLYPLLMPHEYATNHVAVAPTRIKTVFVALSAIRPVSVIALSVLAVYWPSLSLSSYRVTFQP